MRQRVRKTLTYVSLFLFPVTMNFFSPYVSVDGAFSGVVSASVIVFGLLFVGALFFGRAWCGWLCPMAGMADLCMSLNVLPAPVKRLRVIRYVVFAIWFATLASGFVVAGGIDSINLVHLTESGVSVDEPFKYVTYYLVLLTFFGLSLWLGKRGACHAVCWMAPFMTAGTRVGRFLHLERLKVVSEPHTCTGCKTCTANCPMGIAVDQEMLRGSISHVDCIRCAACVDGCPSGSLRLHFGK